jgi:hypothetical protein
MKGGPRLARAFCFMVCLVAATSASALDFDQTFNTKGEPRQLHFIATYRLGETMHEVEQWRDGDGRLLRRADHAVETFAFRKNRDEEFSLVVLDLRKKIRTDVDRTSLARLGQVTDWFSLSHALKQPAGEYELSTIAPPTISAKPVQRCDWYRLKQGVSESRICWSRSMRLPLMILGAADRIEWQVTRIDAGPLPAGAFDIRDQGFVRNDAAREIKGD